MVERLKKSSIWTILYYCSLVSIVLGILICLGVDFLMNQKLSWSLISSVACLMAVSVLTIMKYTQKNQLLKSSLAVSGLLFLLFGAISTIKVIDFMALCLFGSLWLIYYWIILLVFILSKLRFWYWLAFACGLSILMEGLNLFALQHPIITNEFIISNSLEMIIVAFFIFFGAISIDKRRIDDWIEKSNLKKGGFNV
ncbi:MAG: hypothetical protein LKF43_05995 [Streptococcaceae bacterium]|nr:hypothetical protein [Streptococcaceae bacterium]